LLPVFCCSGMIFPSNSHHELPSLLTVLSSSFSHGASALGAPLMTLYCKICHRRCKLFIHSGYFYSTSWSPLLLRGTPDYNIDTASELTRWSAIGNCE